MFSKNLGHVPLTKAQPHCPLSQFFVECQDQKWDWWVSAYGGHCYGIQFSFPLTQCVLHAKHLGESLPITYSPWDETLLLSLTFSREFNLLSPLRSEHSLHDFPISCHSQWNCSLSPGRCWTFSHAALQNLLTSLLHVHLSFHSTPQKNNFFSIKSKLFEHQAPRAFYLLFLLYQIWICFMILGANNIAFNSYSSSK